MIIIDWENEKAPKVPETSVVVPVVPKSSTTKEGNSIPLVAGKKKQISPAKHWVFTYNNPPDDFLDLLNVVPGIAKFVIQKEKGEITGTVHLQGYIEFKEKIRPCSVINWTSNIHWETCKCIPKAIAYCQKPETRIEGPWFKGIKALRPAQKPFEFKEWQKNLLTLLDGEPDHRKIYWFYDEIGGKGKSEIAKWLAINKGAIILGGKGADMKDAIARMPEFPEIIIIDVPRCSTEYVSYQGLEEVKNGCFFSGKYESKMIVGPVPHVIVFANEEPKKDKLSADRWEVIEL